ncbi:MAG: hypothetical protein IPH08_12210 [Rhodocyclaceae bacterium]|jgi:type II secretory pathway component GspD/PulD (secretin)|nr:hypothetical protein [Rhodocyclaceae bacterium]MBK6907786.1 hypothetical protein [Rhodocyclaceae bacterium]
MKSIIGRILWFAAFVLGVVVPAAAQTLETINLRHRSAAEIVPQVQAFVDPGGAITGMHDKLFVRSSVRNLAQIRELVASMDTPRRRLMISLRSDGGGQESNSGGGVQGGVRIINGQVIGTGAAQLYSSDRQQSSDIRSSVQTLDGGRAMLHVGQTYLLPLRQVILGPGGAIISETLVQRDVGSGFVAMPRLNGDVVTIEISPQMETLVQRPNQPLGVVESQRLYTEVSGRLGEWIALGSADTDSATEIGGGLHYGTRTSQRQRRVMLKVESLD